MNRNHTIIIAEAGVNHDGSLEKALRLVDEAAAAGADYVKFQTFHASKLVTAASATAQYQRDNCGASGQLEMLRRLELSEDDFRTIATHCRQRGIRFLSTPFDEESIHFLVDLGVDMMKVPSGEITDYFYLQAIGRTRLPVVLSTGMSTLADIEAAIDLLTDSGTPRESITLLHCNTEYPTPYSDVNLRAMLTMREAFGLPTGYSDHTAGIEVSLAAAALGAVVIEKHFTLSRDAAGPDHAASLDPAQLRELVNGIRNVEAALGSARKCVSPSEAKNIDAARRFLVAAYPIRKGEPLTVDNVVARRAGAGLSPMLWPLIDGRGATRDFDTDQPITI